MQNLFSKFKTCYHLQRHLHYSSASATSTDLFADYLVESLGFSHKLALSTSAKLAPRKQKVNDFKFDANAISVVNLFKFHGFDDTQIRKIVSFLPRLLCSNVEKTLEPKIKMFKDEGFSGSDLITVISRNPQILQLGLETNILPTIGNLRQLLGCNGDVTNLIKKLQGRSFVVLGTYLLPNVALLRSYGIPIELIRHHLIRRPTIFLRNPKLFKDMLVRVEQEIGIPRDSTMFLHGLLVAGLSAENIESKCQRLKSFGWSETDIKTFMMKNPCCFSYSEASFKKKLEFLMNELQLKPAYLTSNIVLFTCSLEKRVMPRHKVFLILKEKGLLKLNIGLCKAVKLPEPRFLKRFVLPFKEVHEVYAKDTGRSTSMMILDSLS